MPGMVLATVFVSLPLVVREVVPVLEEEGIEQEQAAASLGANAATGSCASRCRRSAWRSAYGVVLSIARCIGEYGAVLVVSGNIEGADPDRDAADRRTSSTREQDTQSAYAIAFVLMLVAVAAIAVVRVHPPRARRV